MNIKDELAEVLAADDRWREQAQRDADEGRVTRDADDPSAVISHSESVAISHAAIFHDEWAEAIRSPYVQKFGSDAVLYREHENNYEAASAASDGHGSFAAEPPAEDGIDELVHGIDVFAEAVTNKLLDLERENIELRAKLDAVLTLLGTGDARKKLWKPGDGLD